MWSRSPAFRGRGLPMSAGPGKFSTPSTFCMRINQITIRITQDVKRQCRLGAVNPRPPPLTPLTTHRSRTVLFSMRRLRNRHSTGVDVEVKSPVCPRCRVSRLTCGHSRWANAEQVTCIVSSLKHNQQIATQQTHLTRTEQLLYGRRGKIENGEEI